MANGRYQTLHAHTTGSDGKLDHREILDICQKNNIGVVAFTDHDTLPGNNTLDQLFKINSEVSWISGIELSAGWPDDLGGGLGDGLHIVGLFIDPTDKKLSEHCKKAIKARTSRMEKIVKNLNRIGIKITSDDCLKMSKGESIGRPHIVSAINSYESNKKVIRYFAEKMKKDAMNDLKLAEKYRLMQSEGILRYPYSLFLQKNAYVKDVFVDYLYYKNMDESVSLIRNAGGLAFLAHWFTAKDKLDKEVLRNLLKEKRLDGCETVCGLWSGSNLAKKEINDYYHTLNKITEDSGSLKSGGCDAHYSKDYELFSENKWYAYRTIGMVETIIEKSKINTEWSSIE